MKIIAFIFLSCLAIANSIEPNLSICTLRYDNIAAQRGLCYYDKEYLKTEAAANVAYLNGMFLESKPEQSFYYENFSFEAFLKKVGKNWRGPILFGVDSNPNEVKPYLYYYKTTDEKGYYKTHRAGEVQATHFFGFSISPELKQIIEAEGQNNGPETWVV